MPFRRALRIRDANQKIDDLSPKDCPVTPGILLVPIATDLRKRFENYKSIAATSDSLLKDHRPGAGLPARMDVH